MFGDNHLENGDHAGPYPPVATMDSLDKFVSLYLIDYNSIEDPNEIKLFNKVDSNDDLEVNLIDFAVAANRFNGDLTEVSLVASDWLSEEPTDPLGNPK